jgi:isoquinoline 1-oxidoreductase beta subunit
MMSRRGFMQVALLGGGSLCLGLTLPGCGGKQWPARQADGSLRANIYITVGPDGRVRLTSDKAEMGQGVATSQAMLVAEELEVPLSHVDVQFADAAPEYQTSNGVQATGGSTSTAEQYIPLRRAAASVREMLVGAAAAAWGVSAAACVAEDGVVKHAASGRSTPYGDLVTLAAKRSVPENPRLKKRDQFKIIGKPAPRIDARKKVDGSAVFGMDVVVPGMVRAYILHPPVLGATATGVREGQARAVPGVVDIVTFEAGVAVIAEKYWQARRAAAMVEVEWSRGTLHGLDSEDVRRAARAYKDDGAKVRDDGDVDDVLARGSRGGAKIVEATYDVPYLAHATLEPQNCVAHVRDGEVEVWAPVQNQTLVQELGARAIGVGRMDVIVHTTFIGGGFGRRLQADFVVEAMLLSKRVRRPVQVIWTRESDTRQGYYRPMAACIARGAVDAKGKPTAWSYRLLAQSIFAAQNDFISTIMPDWMPKVARQVMGRTMVSAASTNSFPDILATEGASTVPYDIDSVQVQYTPINTRVPVAFWRSVGHSYNAFFVESFIDELAHAGGRDPLELRRTLLAGDENARALRVLETAAEQGNWGAPLPDGYARGVAVHQSFGTYCAQVIEAGIVNGRIDVRRVVCAVDCGQVVNPDTVVAQMESAIIFGLSAALKQQITLVNGEVQQGNFDDYPLLRMFECPRIEVHIIDSDEKPSGVGEPGLPPVAPALANAIFAATGVRLRRLPLELAWAERGAQEKKAS